MIQKCIPNEKLSHLLNQFKTACSKYLSSPQYSLYKISKSNTSESTQVLIFTWVRRGQSIVVMITIITDKLTIIHDIYICATLISILFPFSCNVPLVQSRPCRDLRIIVKPPHPSYNVRISVDIFASGLISSPTMYILKNTIISFHSLLFLKYNLIINSNKISLLIIST